MKILFCSPFSSDPNIVKGGINVWGNYILSYYKNHTNKGIDIIPISFDRKKLITDTANICTRCIKGIKELKEPIKKALEIINSEKIDIIHICTSGGLSLFKDYFLIQAAKRKGIKTVIHLHFGRIADLEKNKNWEWKLLHKIFTLCDVIIVMNRASETVLTNYNIKNIHYLPNPIGSDIIKQIELTENKQERIPRVLLYVGHVYRTKGVYELVKGCNRIPNIKLRIVGKYSTEIKSDLEKISNQYHKNQWITFVGEISHEKVIEEFLKADIFIFPSYTEGFPNVILEAMACSCPITASNVGAIPEMLNIDNDPCGICFNPKSSQEVYQAVCTLIDNEKLKKELAYKAKKRIHELYTVEIIWKQLTSIWKSLN